MGRKGENGTKRKSRSSGDHYFVEKNAQLRNPETLSGPSNHSCKPNVEAKILHYNHRKVKGDYTVDEILIAKIKFILAHKVTYNYNLNPKPAYETVRRKSQGMLQPQELPTASFGGVRGGS